MASSPMRLASYPSRWPSLVCKRLTPLVTIDLLNWLTGTTGQPAHTTAPRLTHGARARTPCRDQPLRASRRARLEPPGVVPRREQAKERVRQACGACGPNNGRASDAALAG